MKTPNLSLRVVGDRAYCCRPGCDRMIGHVLADPTGIWVKLGHSNREGWVMMAYTGRSDPGRDDRNGVSVEGAFRLAPARSRPSGVCFPPLRPRWGPRGVGAVSRDAGFPIADTDTGLMSDPKVLALAPRQRDPLRTLASVALWDAVRLASWKAGKRLIASETIPRWCLDPVDDLVTDLVAVRLLDDQERIPSTRSKAGSARPAIAASGSESSAGRAGSPRRSGHETTICPSRRSSLRPRAR